MALLSPHEFGPTVVAVVGAAVDDTLESFATCGGVDVMSLRDREPDLASRRIRASSASLVVHDADPLEHVAAAWVELFQERATLGALEAEIDAALDRFERGSVAMPDYYLVVEPDASDDEWLHWWCGALGRGAPRRVMPLAAPAGSSDAGLGRVLSSLPTSRPWPEPATWLPDLAYDIPDRVGVRAGE
ncbi:hypothetical protein GCM10009808_15330 [Microbacterium sediminicola]|uniref:Uncharacterized protein n=1 Tax=Microbacterium sediminicola TaxID=415210 RepID=A0ABN2I537_9MICO